MSRPCPECGVALDADEQFCGSCGCYLDWTDQPAAEPDPRAAPAAAPAAAPGLVERVRAALGPGEQPHQPPPPPPAPPPPPSPPAPAPARPTSGPPPARPPSAPVDRPQQPRAQQPGSAAPPPRRPTAVAAEALQPGDLVCGTCGTGNKPTRRFCRRCGETLAEAVVAKVAWWRRLAPRRTPRTTAVGTRPAAPRGRGRRFPTRLLALVGVLAVLGVGGYALRSTVLGAVESVRDRVQDVEPVVPTEVRASSAQEGHGPGLVKDGTPNKYWAPAEPGGGEGQYVEASFDEPVRLVYLLITPGVSDSDQETFLRQGRPSEVRITVTRDDGTTAVERAELPDKRGATEVPVGESEVVDVRVEVLHSYAGNAEGSRVAIGEVEFLVRT